MLNSCCQVSKATRWHILQFAVDLFSNADNGRLKVSMQIIEGQNTDVDFFIGNGWHFVHGCTSTDHDGYHGDNARQRLGFDHAIFSINACPILMRWPVAMPSANW